MVNNNQFEIEMLIGKDILCELERAEYDRNHGAEQAALFRVKRAHDWCKNLEKRLAGYIELST